jgi:amino acid efflux transporter
MLAAFAIVAVLYLGLAVTTVAVLGGAQGSTVPLADLMQRGLGGAASALTAGAAVLLTVGTTNAYVAGAARLAGSLAQDGSMPAWMARPGAALGAIGVAGVAILALLAAGVVDVDPVVRAISTCFVAVYVAATAAGVRLLGGRLRGAATLSLVLVVVVLAFAGPYLVAPAAVALLASAFVSVRAGGAAWREGSGEAGCRTAWRAGGAAPAPANAGSGGSGGRRPRSR